MKASYVIRPGAARPQAAQPPAAQPPAAQPPAAQAPAAQPQAAQPPAAQAPAAQAPAAQAPAAFSSFERFFRAHHAAVVRIAAGVTGDSQAAQDVAQDVFIAALRRFPDPDQCGHAAGWVRAAAAHAGLNAIRAERRRDRRQQLSGVAAAPLSPEETVLDSESRTEVRQALRRLPRRSAAVLVLRHSGLSYAEVAEAMNVKVGHVGTMLRRAESALRKELQR